MRVVKAYVEDEGLPCYSAGFVVDAIIGMFRALAFNHASIAEVQTSMIVSSKGTEVIYDREGLPVDTVSIDEVAHYYRYIPEASVFLVTVRCDRSGLAPNCGEQFIESAEGKEEVLKEIMFFYERLKKSRDSSETVKQCFKEAREYFEEARKKCPGKLVRLLRNAVRYFTALAEAYAEAAEEFDKKAKELAKKAAKGDIEAAREYFDARLQADRYAAFARAAKKAAEVAREFLKELGDVEPEYSECEKALAEKAKAEGLTIEDVVEAIKKAEKNAYCEDGYCEALFSITVNGKECIVDFIHNEEHLELMGLRRFAEAMDETEAFMLAYAGKHGTPKEIEF